MKIKFLANHPQAIPNIAHWYFTEWGYLKKDYTVQSFENDLQTYLNTQEIPLMLVATQGNNDTVGAVQLKYREMSIYPDKEHWLGGVYVSESSRGQKIAKQMIEQLIIVAKNLGVEKLHLQTERLNGGLYTRLGWQAIEQINYRGIDVLVMERNLLV